MPLIGFSAQLIPSAAQSQFTVPVGQILHLQSATLGRSGTGDVLLSLLHWNGAWSASDSETALAIWDRKGVALGNPAGTGDPVTLSAWCGPGNWSLTVSGSGWTAVGVTGAIVNQASPAPELVATETVAGLDAGQAMKLTLNVNKIVDIGLIVVVTALALRFAWRAFGRLF